MAPNPMYQKLANGVMLITALPRRKGGGRRGERRKRKEASRFADQSINDSGSLYRSISDSGFY